MPDELSPDPLRDARHRRGRPAAGRPGRSGQPRQPWVPVRPGPGRARDRRQSAPAPPSPRPAAPRGRLAPGELGRGARPGGGPDAGGRPGSGRALVRTRALREQLRHAGRLASPPALREPLGLPVVAPGDDLLGARRFRPGADGRPRGEHEGGHGPPREPDRPLGREPRQPAEHRPAPGGGPPPGRPRRDDRRAGDGGGRAVERGDSDPPGDRRRARARDDVGHDRGRAPRRRLHRPSHGRLRRAGSSRPGPRPRVGRADHRRARRPHRGPGAPLRDDAAGDDPARRELDAQGRERLAGGARRWLPPGARGSAGRARWRLRAAARCGEPRPGALRHCGARAPAAGRLRPEPDAARHRGPRRRPGPRASPLRDEHAVLVRRRGSGGDAASRGPTSW